MRIDAHQHFWHYRPETHPWITDPMLPLKRDFLPDELLRWLDVTNFDGCVAVQAQSNVAETAWLLRLADEYRFVRGVVGWVDLCSPTVAETLRRLTANPRLRGVRHALQDEPEEGFMQRADFQRGIGALAAFGLTYDLLISPRQLAAATELVRRFPQQPFILDHIAKPNIRRRELDGWRRDLTKLAAYPNVCCKVSGLMTEADWVAWVPSDFLAYLDVVFHAFGVERLLLGSDWPVCTLAGTYMDALNVGLDYFSTLSQPEQDAIFGGNAVRIYGLPTGGPRRHQF